MDTKAGEEYSERLEPRIHTAERESQRNAAARIHLFPLLETNNSPTSHRDATDKPLTGTSRKTVPQRWDQQETLPSPCVHHGMGTERETNLFESRALLYALTPLVFGGRARPSTLCLTLQPSFDEDATARLRRPSRTGGPQELLGNHEDGVCEPTPQRENVDENWQVDLLYQNGGISQNTMEQRVTPAVAATTCRSQWRRDARVFGPSTTWCAVATHADLSVPPFCGS